MNYKDMSNEGILLEMGKRLRNERLRQNITQNDLVELSGISRRTLVGAENGKAANLSTLIAIMRGLGLLDQLDMLLPDLGVSPMQAVRFKGNGRQRASKKRDLNVAEESSSWQWGEGS